MKKHSVSVSILVFVSLCLLTGCGALRFEPSETAKQNALLHQKTTQAAAQQAKTENSSQQLRGLTELSELQSRAFVGYYGLPKEPVEADTVENILCESNTALAKQAADESVQRPDVWDIADGTLNLAIGIAAIFGGVYGTRALKFLQDAKDKACALREVVKGNELFKQQNNA